MKKHKHGKIISLILLCVGVAVIAYPYIEQYLYSNNVNKQLDAFKVEVKENANQYLELYEMMKQYNKDIYDTNQLGLNEPFAFENPSFKLEDWGLIDNIVGYIDIPDMNVKLPIYLGATKENLTKGAAHLSQTSVPIGGENTNSVIAAHRGYYKAAMFSDIEKLELGDEIYIINYWDTLTYSVVEIKIIEPSQINEILIQENRDLVTLITCHPKWEDNKRYVVYCERVDD
ncbi:class C sortase [Breznakia pachnodae]|uniref:Sortase A n=1 Tax=Breznakia pachnodae TaxID=265178 RepID=A0ABU0E2V6_9FIRM|nr:class C sortase [Breznakia pachnodae]MDQ0361222.1 sortase A [Breznakia pachnodae]